MRFLRLAVLSLLCIALVAQVYSPKLLSSGQPDSTDLTKFVDAIYAQARAQTPRQKAEAIWRFFLTDGRFVKPGFWYHIAGWAYEEPSGEVLDPIKLLNSYGFGLCYHIAPLLQAAFKAGGFKDARCWFLTGHTVTEVFYDGQYHYFDSDMMGYNVAGDGPYKGKPVASVSQLERDGNIFLGKLLTSDHLKAESVDYPWYPADVNAKAIGELARLFTTTKDNYLYSGTRYSAGHSMDFVLRPGEKLIRFFKPEEPTLYYLPYKFDGQKWTEFPQEFAEYQIRTIDGPRSQKDERTWATGRIEYTPKHRLDERQIIIDMPSPYVIIDATIRMTANLSAKVDGLRVETSTNNGQTWTMGGELNGPHAGEWSTQPKVIVASRHGRLTAVSGSYGYRVRITKLGKATLTPGSLHLMSRLELNPRSLPSVQSGENKFIYSSASAIERIAVPAPLKTAPTDLAYVSDQGQEFLNPSSNSPGEINYVLEAEGRTLVGFDAGARFLDLSKGSAPDKLTAETRPTKAFARNGEASIAWALHPEGPFQTVFNYPLQHIWPDGNQIDRLLDWPDSFSQIRNLPPATKRVYLKIKTSGPAIDNIRLAIYPVAPPPSGRLSIMQVWHEGKVRHQHQESISASEYEHVFTVRAGTEITNEAVIMMVD